MNSEATPRYPDKDRPWPQATNTLRIWKQIWQKQNWASVAADRAGRIGGPTLVAKQLYWHYLSIYWLCKVKVYICTMYIPYITYILMLEMTWLGRSMSSIEMKWNIKHWHYNLYNGSHRLPCNTQLVLGWNLKILLETGFHSIWFQANQFKVWHPGARPAGHKRGVRKLT